MSEVTCLINDSNKLTDHVNSGDKVAVLVKRTPFYAESGGQAGDTGTITTEVSTCTKHCSLFIPGFLYCKYVFICEVSLSSIHKYSWTWNQEVCLISNTCDLYIYKTSGHKIIFSWKCLKGFRLWKLDEKNSRFYRNPLSLQIRNDPNQQHWGKLISAEIWTTDLLIQCFP